jgi:hypothetical protein
MIVIRPAYIATIIVFMTGCNASTDEQIYGNRSQEGEEKVSVEQSIESHEQVPSLANDTEHNSVETTTQIKSAVTNTKTKNRSLPEPIATRYIEFPSDANFNGKPMTQQEEISKKVFEEFPDTLSNLAIERYKTYGYFFPKAIADNFEDGVSREIIVYPKKLIFRFHLFENGSASTPYITKDITVRRNKDGFLYTE